MILEILFEGLDIDRRNKLEEMWMLGNCSISNFILKLVLGRWWDWRSS